MVVIDGIKVQIESGSQCLTEYDDLDAEDLYDDGRKQVKYIEAMPEATFSIHLDTQPDFKWHGATGLKVGLRFDNNKKRSYCVKRQNQARPSKKQPSNRSQEPMHWSFTHEKYFCTESNTVKEGSLAFGMVEACR